MDKRRLTGNMMTVFDYLKGCDRVEGAEVFSVVLEGRTGLDGGRYWEETSVQYEELLNGRGRGPVVVHIVSIGYAQAKDGR